LAILGAKAAKPGRWGWPRVPGHDPRQQTLGMGSAQPWALRADLHTWLQPQSEWVCSPMSLGSADPLA